MLLIGLIKFILLALEGLYTFSLILLYLGFRILTLPVRIIKWAYWAKFDKAKFKSEQERIFGSNSSAVD